MTRAELLREKYHMVAHVEGGMFSLAYIAPFEADGRPLAGSIYFLLDKGERSCLHVLDCDEIWYFQEGCGLKITTLAADGRKEILLGSDIQNGEQHMAIIPKGTVFGAENINKDGHTFVSCVTVPRYADAGFKILGRKELEESFPNELGGIEHLVAEWAE